MTIEEFEQALAAGDGNTTYILSLYITGVTPKSSRAIANLITICETYLQNRYELEVIDIYQQPDKAREGDIVAAPTLIKQLPLPLRRLVGDLSNEANVLAGLGLRPKAEKREPELDSDGKPNADESTGSQSRDGGSSDKA